MRVGCQPVNAGTSSPLCAATARKSEPRNKGRLLMRWTAPTTGIEVPDFRLMLRSGVSLLMATSRSSSPLVLRPELDEQRTLGCPLQIVILTGQI